MRRQHLLTPQKIMSASQPAVFFLSHQISISHQPAASQQYFSLTTNQHQPQPAKQSSGAPM